MGAPQFPDDPRVHRVLAVYGALQRRDWQALLREVSPVPVLRIEGRSRYAGTYQGQGQLIALAVQFEERIIPFASEIDEVRIAGDEVHTVVTVSVLVPSNDVFRARLREEFAFDAEGRVSQLVVAGVDQATVDEFLG
ncbi:MAG TPA: hypothetical protein VNN79_22290 [Actinomycetota bacterium]|nr:hypothetical protein [Actinomycetota bacterium]